MKKISLIILLPIAAIVIWELISRTAPPEVAFVKATRETVESSLTTNGKVEPIEWAALRAERAGSVSRVLIHSGDPVKKGQLLVQLNTAEAQSELASANARIAGARAEADATARGGRATDLAEIDSGIRQAKADLVNAQRELDSLRRLAAKSAATPAEVNVANENVQRLQLRIQSFEQRRHSLVSPSDKQAAEARIQEAQALASSAHVRISESQIRSPMNGIVYQMDIRPGAYLAPGTLVASVGVLNKLLVRVYVDEPELGRVAKGMPVSITWDAIPGRQWKGEVDKVPTEVSALGTRQVGEVICVIENPDQTLLPGTNVNAEIRSQVVSNVIAIPKEVLRREGARNGVYKLQGNKIIWQAVKIGVTSVTKAQVLEGVSEGDALALPLDKPLKSGDEVKPIFR